MTLRSVPLQSYVPPDPQRIQATKAAGNLVAEAGS
jgi:hypothetical protein